MGGVGDLVEIMVPGDPTLAETMVMVVVDLVEIVVAGDPTLAVTMVMVAEDLTLAEIPVMAVVDLFKLEVKPFKFKDFTALYLLKLKKNYLETNIKYLSQ